MIKKPSDNYPNPKDEIQRAAGDSFYFEADGLSQFWSIVLDEESRDIMALMTPVWKVRYTRLAMGLKPSSVVAQAAYRRASCLAGRSPCRKSALTSPRRVLCSP